MSRYSLSVTPFLVGGAEAALRLVVLYQAGREQTLKNSRGTLHAPSKPYDEGEADHSPPSDH